MQAENLQSQAKEEVLRHVRRELREKRVRVVHGASARLMNASAASVPVFDEDSCAQPATWCLHARTPAPTLPLPLPLRLPLPLTLTLTPTLTLPLTRCRHAGATDEFMTCGGLAGHFCR